MIYATTGGVRGATGGSVYALRASDGSVLWRYKAGDDNIWASPVVVGEVVYVSTDDYAYALRAGDGTPLWRYQTWTHSGAFMGASPAVADGVVYVGSASHYLYALGALRCRYSTDALVNATPTVSNGVVYVGEMSHTLTALRAGDGAVLWHFDARTLMRGSPVVFQHAVYVGSDDGYVYSIDVTDGAVRWRSAVQGSPRSLQLVGGMLFASTLAYTGLVDVYPPGFLDALNPATGALLWSYSSGVGAVSLPALD